MNMKLAYDKCGILLRGEEMPFLEYIRLQNQKNASPFQDDLSQNIPVVSAPDDIDDAQSVTSGDDHNHNEEEFYWEATQEIDNVAPVSGMEETSPQLQSQPDSSLNSSTYVNKVMCEAKEAIREVAKLCSSIEAELAQNESNPGCLLDVFQQQSIREFSQQALLFTKKAHALSQLLNSKSLEAPSSLSELPVAPRETDSIKKAIVKQNRREKSAIKNNPTKKVRALLDQRTLQVMIGVHVPDETLSRKRKAIFNPTADQTPIDETPSRKAKKAKIGGDGKNNDEVTVSGMKKKRKRLGKNKVGGDGKNNDEVTVSGMKKKRKRLGKNKNKKKQQSIDHDALPGMLTEETSFAKKLRSGKENNEKAKKNTLTTVTILNHGGKAKLQKEINDSATNFQRKFKDGQIFSFKTTRGDLLPRFGVCINESLMYSGGNSIKFTGLPISSLLIRANNCLVNSKVELNDAIKGIKSKTKFDVVFRYSSDRIAKLK